MATSADPSFRKLSIALAAALAVGALLGWIAGGHAVTGVALVALFEVVLLLTRIRHQTQPIMPAPAGVSPLQHDRFMTRSRRIASSLRDLRNAASQLPDAVVLLDQQQQVRWFNHAAENLLGLRRPRDRGVLLHQRLASSDLSGWLQDGALEPINDVMAPGHPESQLNVSMLPFGRRQHLLLARDISHLNRLEQIRRDFVANVSHELRTPLTVIHGYLELIDPEDVPAWVRSWKIC
jgi:two-component system phosphate regulon sensor histidine kinase PhoR